MKIKELLNELKTRESYKEFKEKYPKSFFCAGFFILGNDGDKLQLDFFIEDDKKITSFEYPFNSFILYEDKVEKSIEIKNFDLKVDLDNLQDIIKQKLNKTFLKIIAIFRDNVWNLTCLNGLEMLRLKIDCSTAEIIEEKKGLLTDFIKIQPKEE